MIVVDKIVSYNNQTCHIFWSPREILSLAFRDKEVGSQTAKKFSGGGCVITYVINLNYKTQY